MQPTEPAKPVPKWNSATVQLLQAFGGGVSGALTRFITQPFDVLKIRFQLQVEPVSRKHKSKYMSMMQALRTIYREEGLRGIWKGHTSSQVMSISYAIVQFWSYEQMLRAAKESDMLHDHLHLSYFLCGGAAGWCGVIAAHPFDVVRTRVVASDPHTKASRLRPLSGVYKVFRQDGFPGLTSGLMLTMLQIYPLVGANFLFYMLFNTVMAKIGEFVTNQANPTNELPGSVHFISGGLSGVVSKLVVYPMDVLKKRSMLWHFEHDRKTYGLNPNCSSIRTCIANTLKREGMSGFYKGMMPTLYKSGVMSAFYFSIYDYFNSHFTEPYKNYEKEQEVETEVKKTSWQ